jgi:hypothetical protein
VRNDRRERHASGERKGEGQNYENLFHNRFRSSGRTLPEPARGFRDNHHVLELFWPVAACYRQEKGHQTVWPKSEENDRVLCHTAS